MSKILGHSGHLGFISVSGNLDYMSLIREEDYNTNGQFNSYVAIADASWLRVKDFLSGPTREAIVQ